MKLICTLADQWWREELAATAQRAARALKQLDTLTIMPWDGGYIVSSPDRTSGPVVYGLERNTATSMLPMVSPPPVYWTHEEAAEAIAAVRHGLTVCARGA